MPRDEEKIQKRTDELRKIYAEEQAYLRERADEGYYVIEREDMSQEIAEQEASEEEEED